MQNQMFSRPEALSPIQATAQTLEVKSMKKIIVTLGITAALLVSIFSLNTSDTAQASLNSYDQNLLMAGGGSDWSGG